MAHIAYFRTSSAGQSTAAQRTAFEGKTFDREFADEGVSGKTMFVEREQAAKLLEFIREGDTLHVYALDRLGRDSIDVQTTVRDLLLRGVKLDIVGIGEVAPGPVGKLTVALLAQVADMERERINERTSAGRVAAREHYTKHGVTHNGKASLGGRPVENDAIAISAWRDANGADGGRASISATAAHFRTSESTVKRACAT